MPRRQKETAMPATEKETGYNGWPNHATWCVHLWLSNNQGTYETAREIVANATAERGIAGNLTGGTKPIWHAADALKDWVSDPDSGLIPDLGGSMASDLLSAALSAVDWQEVAQAFMPEEV